MSGGTRFVVGEFATGPLGPDLAWLLGVDTSTSAGVLLRMNGASDQLEQARCVQRAAPDVDAIQRCLQ